MKPELKRGRRPLHGVLLALVAATGLAACGGGSSVDIDGGGTVAGCLSITGGGDGYAIGSCANPPTNVFQKPDVEIVTVNGVDSYTLTIDFPASLPASADVNPSQAFVSTNKTADIRNVLGEVKGQAYEAPNTALTDFFRVWTHDAVPADGNEILALQYANFGTWERFPQDANLGEGYYGAWYGKRSELIRSVWRNGAATYSGWMVGVIGSADSASSARLARFSGRVTIAVDFAGNIDASATIISDLKQSYGGVPPTIEALPLQPLVLVQSGGSTPGQMTGSVESAGGAGATAEGAFELHYFDADSDLAREIAGRLRFTSSDGRRAIGAFAAVLQP